MSIFNRISDILKANINDLLDKAEDPEKMVKQIIADVEEQVRDATEALGQAMASERQAYAQLEKAKANSKEWEDKAKVALKAGNEELAKKALASKDQTAAQTSELRSRVEILRQKLEEARQRQNMLIARAKMADATESVAAAVTNTDPNSALSKLEKMERKVEGKEARAEAFASMAGETVFAKDEFAELEKDQAVDAELQRLMKEMNGGI